MNGVNAHKSKGSLYGATRLNNADRMTDSERSEQWS